MLHVAAQGD